MQDDDPGNNVRRINQYVQVTADQYGTVGPCNNPPAHTIRSEAPPIDCRMPGSVRPVVISDTTAVVLLTAVRELQRLGGLKAHDRDGAATLCMAFDECELIERDLVNAPVQHD